MRAVLLTQIRFDVWRVAPSVLLELDGLGVDNACMRAARLDSDEFNINNLQQLHML